MRLLVLIAFIEVVPDCGELAPPVNDAPITQLAASFEYACDVREGDVECWGANGSGQLGRGTLTPSESRGAVTLPEKVAQLSLGEATACARTVTGRVFCWGANGSQELGTADGGSSPTPREVEVPVPAARVAIESDFVLVVGSDGRLYGWGNNREGTLARGDPNPMAPMPMPVVRAAPQLRFKDVAAGQGHACGLTQDDELWCWGRNVRNETGADSSETQLRTPSKIADGVTHVAPGAFGTCFVASGEVRCSGDVPIDDFGQRFAFSRPTRQDLGTFTARSVDQSWFHLCALTTDDRLFCWGRGIEGQLGLGTNQPQPAPVLVETGVSEVAAGWFFTCVRRVNGEVACAGENNRGQLGLGDTNRRATLTVQP